MRGGPRSRDAGKSESIHLSYAHLSQIFRKHTNDSMANPFPSWAHRDIETLIKWLLDASVNLGDIENETDLPKPIREKVSDARTSVKGALMLAREVRSSQEDLMSDAENQKAQDAAAQKTKHRPDARRD